MLTKYAEVAGAERTVEVLDAFVVPENSGQRRLSRLRRRAHRHNFEYTPRRGYIYVRSRAISSRCNDNYDEFPAEEIKKAYRTFIGKPVFVNHHNSDHRRARGVIIDAALHEDINPDGTPDTWAEVLMEVDAVRFPVLAREVKEGNIARTSMGTDVEYSECTACGNKAYTPADYCQHIPKMKGMKLRRPVYTDTGKVAGTEEVLIAERCYGLRFFENSLLVEDPADPTAVGWMDYDATDEGISAAAARAVIDEAETIVREAYPSRRDVADMMEGRKPHGEQAGHPTTTPAPSQPARRNGPPIPDDWFTRENIDTNNDIDPAARKNWLKNRQRNQRGDAQVFKTQPTQHNLHQGPVKAHRTASRQAGLMDYYEVIVHHRGDEVPMKEYGTADLLEAIKVAQDIWDRERPIYCAVDNAGTDTVFWENGANTTSGRFASRHVEAGQCIHCNPALRATGATTMCDSHAFQAAHGTLDFPSHNNSTGSFDYPHHSVHPTFATHHEADSEGWTPRFGTQADYERGVRDSRTGKSRTGPMPDESLAYIMGLANGNNFASHPEEMPQWDQVRQSLIGQGFKESSRHVHSYGEVKAPAKVDTLRAEACPVCGDDEGFNGAKCNVCGFMQPPSQFQDPDLTKAQEQDLRQEQSGGLPDPAAVGQGLDDPAPTDPLQCTNCGEVFSAEGEPATDAEPEPDPAKDESSAPEAEDDQDGQKDGDPADLDDLADLSDDEIFGDDEDEDHPDEKDPDEDPDQVDDPTKYDPAVGEGRITAEPEGDAADPDGIGSLKIEPNMTCPICGEGTLVPQAGQDSEGTEPKVKEVGTDPAKAKETVAMNQPNPAQQRRNRIIQAMQGQQREIQALKAENAVMRRAVAHIAVAAGLSRHAAFAGIVRDAGLKVADAPPENNDGDSIGSTPATTTEEAKKPDATADVEAVGAVPDAANKGVTPEGVTDVNNSDVVANPPVLDNLQSVTTPVAGTDAPTPAAGDAAGTSTVTVGTPSNATSDLGNGWSNTAAKGSETERYTASLRLARLRIQAGIEQGEDLTIAEKIASSDDSLEVLNAQVNALASVASKTASAQQPPRHLVPRRAATQGVQPTRQPSLTSEASTSDAGGDDQWMFGDTDL